VRYASDLGAIDMLGDSAGFLLRGGVHQEILGGLLDGIAKLEAERPRRRLNANRLASGRPGPLVPPY
jgi:hypothetical protein